MRIRKQRQTHPAAGLDTDLIDTQPQTERNSPPVKPKELPASAINRDADGGPPSAAITVRIRLVDLPGPGGTE